MKEVSYQNHLKVSTMKVIVVNIGNYYQESDSTRIFSSKTLAEQTLRGLGFIKNLGQEEEWHKDGRYAIVLEVIIEDLNIQEPEE